MKYKFFNKLYSIFFPNWVVVESKSGRWKESNELITFMGDKMTKYDTDTNVIEYHWNISILYSNSRGLYRLSIDKFIGGHAKNNEKIQVYQNTLIEFTNKVGQLNKSIKILAQ